MRAKDRDEAADSELLGPEFSRIEWSQPYSQIKIDVPSVFATADLDVWKRNYEQLPSQAAFHQLTERYKGFSGPVGSGKSYALAREAIRLAYANPGCAGLLGAPSYRMLEDVTQEALFRELAAAGIDYRFRAGAKKLTLLDCKSTIILRSLSDPRRLVGTNLGWFGVDELTFCPMESWRKLEARLRDKRADQPCGFAVWTPRGFDWVWKRFKNPETKLPKHGCIFATPGENKKNLQADYYEYLKHSYDERLYQQEALGIYLSIFTGQAYYSFDRYSAERPSNLAPVKFDPHLPLCWALDFNVARMSSVIAQYKPVPGEQPAFVHVLDEIMMPDSNTAATCDEFMDRLEILTRDTALSSGVVNVRIYGDAAGESRSSKATKTDYQIIREWGSRNAHRVSLTFKVPDANPPVKDRVASVNALLYNARKDRILAIHPQCKHLIEDLEQVGWAIDKHGNYTGELDKSKAHLTHFGDALGYIIWSIAPIKRRGGPVERTTLRL